MRMRLCPTVLSLLLLAGLLCACAGQQAPVVDTTSDTTIAPSPVVPTATATEEDVDTVSTPTIEGSLDTASDPTIVHSIISNPAAVYCVDLGYDYQIVQEAGGQVGYCVLPDGSTCDGWDFLEGTCGQEYNYCAQQGYDTVTRSDGKNPFSRQYAVCIDEEGREVMQVTEMFNLMERSTGCEGETTEMPQREVGKDIPQGDMKPVPVRDEAPPSSFDWRNHNGSNWVTSVKDQGGCGSCWAFSAVGATEAAHNIANNDPGLDLDLAEQYLVSRCLSGGTCCGGSKAMALQEIRDEGIPDEGCMPYVDGAGCSCSDDICDTNCTYLTGGDCSDQVCSDRCADWASRLETIGGTSYVGTNTTTIKQRIVDVGPLAVSLRMRGSFDANDIYRCDPDDPTTHAVVVVGYDDNGGYWIVKNSWGATWGPDNNGYFKVGYGECYIEQYMYDVVVCNDPHEPNDVWGEATPIAYGDTSTDPDICPAGDVDYYAFTGSAGDTVVADIDAWAIGSSLDSYLYLYDTDGVTELTHNDDYDGLDSRIEYTLPANGTYYLKVREYNHPNEGGPDYFYTLKVFAVASFPFCDGFEAGDLGIGWMTYVTDEGRVQVSASYPYLGTYSVLLDDSIASSSYSHAALILTIDLSGQSDVDLDFWWRDFDDEDEPEDGVFFSDDWGTTWVTATNFTGYWSSFKNEVIDVDVIAAANGLTLNDHFQIKFQFYDDYPIPTDGYAIDEVCVQGFPDIGVSPTSFEETVPEGEMVTKTLTINNTGTASLAFSIREVEGGFTPLTSDVGQLHILSTAEVDVAGVNTPQGGPSRLVATHRIYEGALDSFNILVYADNDLMPTPNPYVEEALQAMGLSYTAYNGYAGFETALSTGGPWDLVIVSSEGWSMPSSTMDALYNYITTGDGRLIYGSWDAYMSYAAHSLFTYCGVSLVNDYTSPLPVYWWTSHLLFNGVPQFTTMTDHYYRDGQYMDAVPGISTALAGYTTSPATSQVAIVIRDDGTTIVNGFDVDENHEDLDADSFYDGVELYMNEIHFLLYGSDVPWLSEDPTSGTVSAGGSLPVDVIFNATGLALGDYTADLVIYSNDPDESPVTVPVVMHVGPEEKNYLPIILKNYP